MTGQVCASIAADDVVVRERQRPDPDAESIGERIADRGGHRSLSRLTRAERRLVGAVQQMDFDQGHLAEPRDRIGLPVGAGDRPAVEPDLLEQRPAGGLDRATLDLVAHPVDVHGPTDVDGDRQSRDPQPVGGLDVGDDGAVRTAVLVAAERHAPAMTVRQRRSPVGRGGGGVQHLVRARV